MMSTQEVIPLDFSVSPRALVVDDDEALSSLLEFIFQRQGYVVDVLHDGLKADEHISSDCVPPDVVILDIMLPRVDGFALLRKIRQKPSWKEVPVLMLSALGDEQNIVRALDAGANDYVQKPFKPEELKARVRRLVRKSTH